MPSKQFRRARQFDKNFLEQIARVRLVAREIQEKGIERLGVFIVKPCDVQSGGHFHNDAPGGGICLAANVFSRPFSSAGGKSRFHPPAGIAYLRGMNCIVTAGPTFEPLDDVRRLTNFSTGRLGTELANFLTARGHRVTLLIGESATYAGRTPGAVGESFFHHGGFAREAESVFRQKSECHFSRGGGERFRFRQNVHARRGREN